MTTLTSCETRVVGDPAGRGEPVEQRHPDVHQDDVGAQFTHPAQRLLAVGGLPGHLDVGLGVEQRPEPRPDQQPGRRRAVRGSPVLLDLRDACTGSTASTRNPPSARGPASIVPPSAAARSRIPTRPLPLPPASAPVAGPSSSIRSRRRHGRRDRRRTRAWRDPECRTTLVRASWTMRKAARSVPGGSVGRLAPSISTVRPGARRLLDEFGEPVEARRRGARGVAGRAQGVEDLADLAQRLLAGRLDGGERGAGLFRVGVEEREADTRLDVDHRDAVREDVVQFAGDPQPLLVGAAPLGRPAHARPAPGPTARAGSRTSSETRDDRHAPRWRRRSPAPRRAASSPPGGSHRYSQCATSTCPAHSTPIGRPGGLAVPGDDGAEAAERRR